MFGRHDYSAKSYKGLRPSFFQMETKVSAVYISRRPGSVGSSTPVALVVLVMLYHLLHFASYSTLGLFFEWLCKRV